MSAIERHGDFSRAIVTDSDDGTTIARMLAFRGTGHVRIVVEAELERSGLTLHYGEAVAWRDALSEVIAEIDDWRSAAHHHEYVGGRCTVCGLAPATYGQGSE